MASSADGFSGPPANASMASRITSERFWPRAFASASSLRSRGSGSLIEMARMGSRGPGISRRAAEYDEWCAGAQPRIRRVERQAGRDVGPLVAVGVSRDTEMHVLD